jgi:hypothetical protein
MMQGISCDSSEMLKIAFLFYSIVVFPQLDIVLPGRLINLKNQIYEPADHPPHTVTKI